VVFRERERGEMQDGADHPVILKKLETADCRAGFAIACRDGARLHPEARMLARNRRTPGLGAIGSDESYQA
jgi:hypothetical protein